MYVVPSVAGVEETVNSSGDAVETHVVKLEHMFAGLAEQLQHFMLANAGGRAAQGVDSGCESGGITASGSGGPANSLAWREPESMAGEVDAPAGGAVAVAASVATNCLSGG